MLNNFKDIIKVLVKKLKINYNYGILLSGGHSSICYYTLGFSGGEPCGSPFALVNFKGLKK